MQSAMRNESLLYPDVEDSVEPHRGCSKIEHRRSGTTAGDIAADTGVARRAVVSVQRDAVFVRMLRVLKS